MIIELLPQYQQDLSAAGAAVREEHRPATLVPLKAVATLSKSLGPVTINHSGQLPSVTISFNLAPGASLGAATAEVQRLAEQTLPSGDHDGVLGNGAGVPVDAGRPASSSSSSRCS